MVLSIAIASVCACTSASSKNYEQVTEVNQSQQVPIANANTDAREIVGILMAQGAFKAHHSMASVTITYVLMKDGSIVHYLGKSTGCDLAVLPYSDEEAKTIILAKLAGAVVIADGH